MELYKKALADLLGEVHSRNPLVHQITNYVTANDCANVVLALGGRPVMAEDQGEVEEMVAIASALVLNLGTLNDRKVDAMIAAGRRANGLGIPVILDPVGVGATRLRLTAAQRILNEVRVAVVRGNLSEARALTGENSKTCGVDSSEGQEDGRDVAICLSQQRGCVVAITGVQDIITDGTIVVSVSNGHQLLTRVTGTGCMTSALVGAYSGVTDNDYLLAAIAGVATMGLAGESAATEHVGLGTFRIKLLDYISKLTPSELREVAKINAG
ncbi:MAG: hydroxyethylthiazole kinase [Bacillota bacterium]|nr:hydroxyethylthiazole kinase [Bacillota bacterium]